MTPRYGRGSHLEVWNGDECRTLRRGDTIPPNTPHGAETKTSTCLVLDVFHPLREDYVKLFSEG